MQEIEAVLRRKFNLSLEEWLLVLEVIKENITIVRVKQLPIVPELRDKADRHILAATHEVRADYIISGDEDLLTLGSYKGIPIINPSAPST